MVRNKNGCGEVSATFVIMDYPKFFTPNNDGHNDTWNIRGSSVVNIKSIYIFDRYGKLLKELSPNGEGWNGIYNSRKMPADDYWFTIEYQKDGVTKQFKSHFALKR
jgi:gliding motility-associated-like protein